MAKQQQQQQHRGTGRRKSATARAYLIKGEGKIIVNGRAFEEYFVRGTSRMIVRRPLEVTDTATKFDIKLNIAGGGNNGQAGAARLAIARALLGYDETFRQILRAEGFLTRDAREVERKKVGLKKARKATQFSKR